MKFTYISMKLVDAELVASHLRKYCLIAKESVCFDCSGNVRILGLRVDENVIWRRNAPFLDHAIGSCQRAKRSDTLEGRWPVDKESNVMLCTDASPIATGSVLEITGDVVEDECWLCSMNDSADINLAELDAVIRGISLMVSWGFHGNI